MTNTVAHTTPRRGTSRRLGLRLPAPKPHTVRIDELIVGPADVWSGLDDTMRQELADTSATLFDTTFLPGLVAKGLSRITGETWYRPIGTDVPVAPIHFTSVTATRGGEPVHISEVMRELMDKLVPERRQRVETAPSDFVTLTGTECCDVLHVFNSAASSWLPGCAHLGTV